MRWPWHKCEKSFALTNVYQRGCRGSQNSIHYFHNALVEALLLKLWGLQYWVHFVYAQTTVMFQSNLIKWAISGFSHGVNEIFVLLECYPSMMRNIPEEKRSQQKPLWNPFHKWKMLKWPSSFQISYNLITFLHICQLVFMFHQKTWSTLQLKELDCTPVTCNCYTSQNFFMDRRQRSHFMV
jgi:hypothetical protein